MSVFLIIALQATASAAGQFWAQKGREEWSQAECQRLLRDSPWAASVTGVLDPSEAGIGRGAGPRMSYVVQLWSAKPVRMALARSVQFEPRYLVLSKDERQQMNADATGFIEESYADAVVVQVMYGANLSGADKDLRFFWGSQKMDAMKSLAALAGPRGRVELKEFTAKANGRDEMQLVFPRRVGGKALVEPGDEAFALDINCPRFKNVPAHRISVQFAAAKMMFEGKLEY